MISKEYLQSYFHADYRGAESILRDVLEPIFGQANIINNQSIIVTPTDKQKAQHTNIIDARHIATLWPVGSDESIKVFDVIIEDRCHIHIARKGIQHLVREWVDRFEGAFIIFHYANTKGRSWRLSYMEKRAKNADSTSAKRYTYLCGQDYPCRTIAERFSQISPDNINSTILEQAFSVEALSNEFFDTYREFYADFIQHITGKRYIKESGKWVEKEICAPNETIYNSFHRNDKDIRDYIKKMMGRLVFLCFLQRKGWFGGNQNYLHDTFYKSSQQDNFLEAVLEPLFFGLLNTKTEHRAELFQRKGWDISLIPNADTIPYLNGGLFEQDDNDDRVVVFPKEMFQRLFDFFASYNFTIDENDPEDAEIGVDPEMLGKIFESLLEDNKDKGAFYTPKEIVRYMCRESLIAYLTTKSIESNNGKFPREQVETKVRELLTKPHEIVPKMTAEQLEKFGNAIREVKICDPAVGSGAFPMGLLNELVRCRVSIHAWAKDAKGNLLEGNYAELKRDIIQNNIYGVDIEKGAIDIARLRFWLSIVVDEEEPKALPNFDYKFMVGNSLIPTFDGEYINLDTKGQKHTNTIKMNEKKQELLRLKRRYYDASGDDKLQLGIEIKDTILQLISLQLGYELRSWAANHVEQSSLFPEPKQTTIQEIVSQLPPERQRIVDLGKQLRARLADTSIPLVERARTDIQFFDWRMMFTEVFDRENGGFDIVIGNPPYIKERENQHVFEKLKGSTLWKKYHVGKMDYWYFFLHQSIDMCAKDAIICMITSRYWINSFGAKKIIQHIKRELNILSILDIGSIKVFDNVVGYHMVALYAHNKIKIPCQYKLICDQVENIALMNFAKQYQIPEDRLFSNNDEIVVEDRKQISSNLSLGDICTISQGVVEASDKISRKMLSKQPNPKYHVGDGIFVLTKEELNQLSLQESEEKIIKLYLGDGAIKKYYIDYDKSKYLIYSDKETREKISDDINFLRVKEHLDKYSAYITSCNKPYGLHRSRQISYFETTKIVTPSMFAHPSFSIDDQQIFVGMSYNVIIPTEEESVLHLVGILNSKFADFWFYKNAKHRGVGVDVGVDKLREFPIVNNADIQTKISNLVDRILAAKKTDPAADTSDLENQIDELVYDLYGLTEDEKEIIRKG